ncbi:MAG TPA: MlaD family protein [Bacteroidia bacterium]|nr:MlaD family protein [Bacteroidia bacterium]
MNESPNRRAIIVGVFVLLGIVFLIGGILTIGNLHKTFSKKMNLTAIFDDVNGLQQGNNIWFSGVKIGTVKRVQFYGNSEVKVVMNIDEKSQQYIRKDAKVKVSADGLIGNKILVIYGGTSKADGVEDDDTLSVEKTFTSEDMINTLQENNINILAITNDFKTISKKMANGQGSIGKLLNDEAIYDNIAATSASLKQASDKAQNLIASLNAFTSKLNKKGSLANDLVTDTSIFNSIRSTVLELNKVADTASAFISELKTASKNPKTPAGVLLRDEEAGASLKASLKNLESGSKKLDEDLEGLQHSFPLKRYFKKKAKENKK